MKRPSNKLIKRIVEVAKALREKEQTGQFFHVSFICKGVRILAIGMNNYYKSHPICRLHPYKAEECSIHSELSATIKFGEEDLSHYSFFNVRIGNNGNVMNSKPCAGCQSLLKQLNVRRFFHSTDDGEFKYMDI